MDVAPKQRTHVVVAVQHLEQRLGIAQPDAVHPAAANGYGMVMQTDQVMPLGRLAQGAIQQLELIATQHAIHRAGNQGVEHHDAPATDLKHWLHQLTATGGLAHGAEFIMVAGTPARWRLDAPGQLAEALVGRHRTVLGQITGSQDQVDARLLFDGQLDHPLQTVAGIHAQQLAVRFGKQVAIGELHQQNRIFNSSQGRTRQGPSP